MYAIIESEKSIQLKFDDDTTLSNLFIKIKLQFQKKYKHKYSFTNSLIASLAIKTYMIGTFDEFQDTVIQYEKLNKTTKIKLAENNISRVRIKGSDRHIIEKIKTDLLIHYNVAISVNNLFRLAMLSLLQVDEMSLKAHLSLPESDNNNTKNIKELKKNISISNKSVSKIIAKGAQNAIEYKSR